MSLLPSADETVARADRAVVAPRLAAWLTIASAGLLVTAIPVLGVVLAFLEPWDVLPHLLLGMVVLVTSTGVAGAVLGRAPRLPEPSSWGLLLVATAGASPTVGGGPAALLDESTFTVGAHGVAILAGATMTGFSAAREWGSEPRLRRTGPVVVASLVAVCVAALLVRPGGPAMAAGGPPMGGAAPAVVLAVAAVWFGVRIGARLLNEPGGAPSPWTVAAIAVMAPALVVGVLPLAVAVGPFVLLGAAMGNASAARRQHRKEHGGRRTKHHLDEVDARALAVLTVALGLVFAALAILTA